MLTAIEGLMHGIGVEMDMKVHGWVWLVWCAGHAALLIGWSSAHVRWQPGVARSGDSRVGVACHGCVDASPLVCGHLVRWWLMCGRQLGVVVVEGSSTGPAGGGLITGQVLQQQDGVAWHETRVAVQAVWCAAGWQGRQCPAGWCHLQGLWLGGAGRSAC